MPPPPTLDGARVLWWAWSCDVPFGEMPGAEDPHVFGFAVCRYDQHGDKYYRFSCNRHWEVLNDMDYLSEEDAKEDIPGQYDASRVDWQLYRSGRQSS